MTLAVIQKMKKIFILILIIFVSSILCQRAFSTDSVAPPALFVDKGACPFECCTYREWKAEKDTILYRAPKADAETVATIKSGKIVNAMTGEVHTIPVKFIVKTDRGQYKATDIIWVYTYLGEGYFKVWFKGKIFEEELGFSPYGGTPGRRCEKSSHCFGELQSELRFTWWVKIKGADGKIGWSNQPENFSNKDACG